MIRYCKSPKFAVIITVLLLVLLISSNVFAFSTTINNSISTDTPNAPVSYHFTATVGESAYNVFGVNIWTNKRTMDWNIKSSGIISSNLSPSFSTGFLSPWGIAATGSQRYYSSVNEQSWAAGDVASCAIDCKATVSFAGSASGSGAGFTAGVNMTASAVLGQYVCMSTVADVQKYASTAKSSYCYMRMQS